MKGLKELKRTCYAIKIRKIMLCLGDDIVSKSYALKG